MDVLSIFLQSIPYAAAFALACGVIVFTLWASTRPLIPLLAFIGLFFTFSATYQGRVEVANIIYSRGVGYLFFPALLWLLLFLTLATWTGVARRQEKYHGLYRIVGWFGGWLLLLAAHVVWGVLDGQKLSVILSGNGFSLVPWMGLMVLMLIWSGRSDKAPLQMARFIVLFSFGKSIFGLVRYFLFGGDPANIYQNYEKINIKLTYFDINDSLVCFLGLAVSVSLLLINPESPRKRNWQWIYIATIVASSLCIVLSYRRSAWIGLVLAAAFLVWKTTPRLRITAFLSVMPIMLFIIAYAMGQRLGNMSNINGFASMYYDLSGSQYASTTQRALELQLAWEAFLRSPIVGTGAWGQYASAGLITWHAGADAGSFLHSGLLHIAMKTGIVGLTLFGGVLFVFVVHARSMRRHMSPENHALAIAGCAGLFFMLPDMLIGTPIPQLRTTQLLAFCIGLPFFASSRYLQIRTA